MDLLLAPGVALAAYALSCLLVWPEPAPAGFGEQWQLMSAAPFELRGQFPQRILMPLLAHLAGCGGEHYIVFVRGVTIALLASVFLYARQLGSRRMDALLVVAAVALTAPVQNYKQHWVGYADPLGFTLFVWAAMTARRRAVLWLLLLASLFHHELAVFFVPWLWILRRQSGGAALADGIWLAAAGAVYGAFYLWVKANAAQQLFDASYFAQHPLFPSGTLLVWSLALTHWSLAFGPVLAVVAWHQHVRVHGAERFHFRLQLLGVLLVFCIAFDWSRHANLILPAFVLAAARFMQAGYRSAFALLLAGSLAVTVAVPQWSTTPWPVHARLVMPAFQSGLVLVSPDGYGFGSLAAFFGRWLPAVWPTLGAVAVLAAGIWGFGAWLAWHRK